MHLIDWRALHRLRATFLDGTAGQRDYWQRESDLASYDQTFAQRIGWKWDYVLNELKRRGWSPPPGEVLDFGCGTGIASRKFLQHFGTTGVTRLSLCDRSPLAMQFAARRVREEFPDLDLWLEPAMHGPVATLLISHVLTESGPPNLNAACVLWVEPGTYEASRQLIAVRENVRSEFNVVAPCPHQTGCGMLTTGNERHWCHQFAASPAAAFTDGDWAQFAKLAGIDLRSLPVSYLVLDKRPPPVLPAGATRAIGRPRVYKAHALVLRCGPDGVRDCRLTKREAPEEFRRLKKRK